MKETLSFVVVQPHSFLYYREAEKETKVRQSLVGFSVGRVIDPGRRKRAISSAGTNSFFISFQTESCCSFSQQLGVILVHSFIFFDFRADPRTASAHTHTIFTSRAGLYGFDCIVFGREGAPWRIVQVDRVHIIVCLFFFYPIVRA